MLPVCSDCVLLQRKLGSDQSLYVQTPKAFTSICGASQIAVPACACERPADVEGVRSSGVKARPKTAALEHNWKLTGRPPVHAQDALLDAIA